MRPVKHLIPEFDALRARFPAGFESSLVLPCLRRVQEDKGYVADSDIDALVGYLGVPRIQIEEVLSFYTQYRRQPVGRWQLQVCRNVSCSMRGAERLLEALSQKTRRRAWGDDAGRALHAVDRRMPGLLRDRPGRDGQRGLSRERRRRNDRRPPRAAALMRRPRP